MSYCGRFVREVNKCVNSGRSGCVKVNLQHDCHRWCEKESNNPIWKSMCKDDCNSAYAFFSDTKNTPEDISYCSADSFSVL